MYDIVIVGAGPAGIFTALELLRKNSDKKILIVEKGASVEKRVCPKAKKKVCLNCDPCAITTGFSGAGAFSDGKLSLSYEVGGDLPTLIGEAKAQELIDYTDGIYLEFGADEHVEGLENSQKVKDIRKRAIQAGLKLVDCPIRHLGTENAQKLYYDIEQHLLNNGVEILFGYHYTDIILAEARKRDMRVWILDDKHFPTGYANGILAHSDPSLRRRVLREFHVDVMGPAQDVSLLMPHFTPEEKLLAVVMYRRTGKDEELTGEPMLLEAKKEDKFVYLDVPEGLWRVFYVSESYTRSNSQKDYVDMLSRESVHKLIEAVYEPHYAHYAALFGKTIAGFFSDEPRFDAQHVGQIGYDTGIYNRSVGVPGVELPWRDTVEAA